MSNLTPNQMAVLRAVEEFRVPRGRHIEASIETIHGKMGVRRGLSQDAVRSVANRLVGRGLLRRHRSKPSRKSKKVRVRFSITKKGIKVLNDAGFARR